MAEGWLRCQLIISARNSGCRVGQLSRARAIGTPMPFSRWHSCSKMVSSLGLPRASFSSQSSTCCVRLI
jgi:hypothetical protein